MTNRISSIPIVSDAFTKHIMKRGLTENEWTPCPRCGDNRVKPPWGGRRAGAMIGAIFPALISLIAWMMMPTPEFAVGAIVIIAISALIGSVVGVSYRCEACDFIWHFSDVEAYQLSADLRGDVAIGAPVRSADRSVSLSNVQLADVVKFAQSAAPGLQFDRARCVKMEAIGVGLTLTALVFWHALSIGPGWAMFLGFLVMWAGFGLSISGSRLVSWFVGFVVALLWVVLLLAVFDLKS